MRNLQWHPFVIVLVFAKGCVFPGWSSASEFAFACALVGALTYWKPRSPLESKHMDEVERLRTEVHAIRESLVGLKMKLGFRPAPGVAAREG